MGQEPFYPGRLFRNSVFGRKSEAACASGKKRGPPEWGG